MNRLTRIFRGLLTLTLACASLASCRSNAAQNLDYKIVVERAHDPAAYTQGLQWVNGRLFESTGLYGKSSVREVNRETGEVTRQRQLPHQIFAEGLTLHRGELWLLTWKEQTAYVLQPETFELIRTHKYQGEGWGLTSDGSQLIMSDGSSNLKFINPANFTIQRTLPVTDRGRALPNLNELEWVNGEIFANIYGSDRIARISPQDGQVTGWIDLSALRNRLPRPHRAEELNGIAYDTKSRRFLVTGKNWPSLFEIEIVAR